VRRIRVFLNDGEGYYTEVDEANIPYSSDHSYLFLKAADINGDGKQDLFAGGRHGSCYGWNARYMILINGGDPFDEDSVYFFNQTNTWLTDHHKYAWDAAIVDFDQDGDVDMYLGRYSNQQNAFFLGDPEEGFIDVTVSHLPSIGDDTRRVHADDFDMDGDLDIYVTNWGQDRMHLQEIDHKFADVTTSNLPTVSMQSHDSSVGDYDGDGLPDIFSVSYDQKNQLFLNIGEGSFEDRSENLPWDDDYCRGVATGDFDGDGDIDAFVVNSGQDRLYINVSQ